MEQCPHPGISLLKSPRMRQKITRIALHFLLAVIEVERDLIDLRCRDL
jgi:hypothetical protein